MPKSYSVKLNYVVYATPLRVFDALTQSIQIEKWSGGKGKVELKPGGDMELFDGWVKGKVLNFKPAKSLSYTWKPNDWDKKAIYSTVEFSFHDHKAGTEIVLEHYDFPNEEEASKHKEGWIDYVFEPLNEMFTS